MTKTIWLINPYAAPPQYETRIQTLKRAQYLSEFGYDVTIIGGSYIHNTEINLIKDKRNFIKENYNGIKFIHIRTSNYNKNGIKRILNLLEFSFRLFLISNKLIKPDVIIHTATVPFGNILYFLSKKFKSRYIVDVLDLWPETFFSLGLISKKNPLLKLAYLAEKWQYYKADEIVFSMEGGKDYIIEKGWDLESGGKIDLKKVHYINNGVDLDDFKRCKNSYKLIDEDLINDKIFKVIYLGSIRLANDVKKLIDAAIILKDRKDIQFLIYGDGEERNYLENYSKIKNLNNVKFKQKRIELKYVPYVLSRSSLNILNYKKSNISRFGGSQSKSFQYMASGKPICANLKMAYCPITKFNLGVAKEFDSATDYANSILTFVQMDADKYNELCNNSKNAALNYNYKKLTASFEKLLL